MSIRKTITDKANRLISMAVNSVAQKGSERFQGAQSTDALRLLARQMGAEGIVLLKNEKQTLPLPKDKTVSVFGRVQVDTFFVGYGSGGDVNAPYKVSILEGLRNCEKLQINEDLAAVYEDWSAHHPVDDGYWGHWPMCYDEMPVSDKLVQEAAKVGDTAIVIIGRAAGEDRENTLTEGSYYLTKEEKALLDQVTKAFKRVAVLLNVGSIMDMHWLKDYGERITTVAYIWQNGMETGNSVADVLCGDVTPSGCLCDTIALRYEDYPSSAHFGNKAYNEYAEDVFVGYRFFETFAPSRVLFPFGFGLSYTTFSVDVTQTRISGDDCRVWVKVKNTGDTYSGKHTVQMYLQKPQGVLSQPERMLVAFAKTNLLQAGEEEKLCLHCKLSDYASYDDTGLSGHRSAWIFEAGVYNLYVGADVRSAAFCRSFTVRALQVVRQCSQICAPDPRHPFERLVLRKNENGKNVPMTQRAPTMQVSLRERILRNLPQNIEPTGDCGIKLQDVKNGKATLAAFTAQLSVDELEAITRGDYSMDSPLGAKGNAGAIGGVLPSLREKGIPAVITTDGPSGIRLSESCSLLPNGAALACSFNRLLVQTLFSALAQEMAARGSDILLAPGMNIHRNPLCGRNFEYFSEDPCLTGLIASSYVQGIQSGGLSACPKHFCCNNQEFNRTHNDSRVSERALREIYLKGFELCVREAQPHNIMTSYNKVNGVWSHYNYDLCTTVLRGEWGFQGSVMTDWWMRKDESHEFPGVIDQGYRVRAGVDVLMPGGARGGKRKPDGTLKKSMKAKDGVTLGELQSCAMHVLKMAMNYLK